MPAENASKPDQELSRLEEELRVVMPGVQVLFAFLLTVAFTQRFQEVTDVQRFVYMVAFLSAAVATICFMAPTAMHRIEWRRGDLERLLERANLFTIAGIGFVAVSVGCVVFLVSDVVYDGMWTPVITAGVVTLIALCWFGLPIVALRRDGGSRPNPAGTGAEEEPDRILVASATPPPPERR